MMYANDAFYIFMHTAKYATLLFGTFPMLRVNRYYRDLVNVHELRGVSYQQRCGVCLRQQAICIYAPAFEEFECLVCRASIPRPWYDGDAGQFIGHDEEVRPEFLLDLRAWGWVYAARKLLRIWGCGIFDFRECSPLRAIGEYIADTRTWKAKWVACMLTQTTVGRASDMRYVVWRWYKLKAGINRGLHYPNRDFDQYIMDEENAWLAQDHVDGNGTWNTQVSGSLTPFGTLSTIDDVELGEEGLDHEYTDDDFGLSQMLDASTINSDFSFGQWLDSPMEYEVESFV